MGALSSSTEGFVHGLNCHYGQREDRENLIRLPCYKREELLCPS